MNPILAFDLESVARIQSLAGCEPVESCAVGLVAPAGSSQGRSRFVVSQFEPVPEYAYLLRSPMAAVLSPDFCVDLANRARFEDLGILIAHTHIGEPPLQSFSVIDDQGELSLASYFSSRVRNQPHFSAMFTNSGGCCRQLGTKHYADMQLVGRDARIIPANSSPITQALPQFSRQAIAFGPDIQSKLSALKIAIVGLGGTGSVVATELAHLGVQTFLLIDPDEVEVSNLNRLIGAILGDCGTPKVTVFAKRIRELSPQSDCQTLIADVVNDETAKRLLDCDFIFLCTDSHASRAVVNQIAYQYLIPTIDMGVAIHTTSGKVDHVVGRVQMISSGLACLVCSGWINPTQVRFEMMNAEQRRNDAYFPGEEVPQPAVISLNAAVASVAITTFLSAMAALPSEARLIHYDAIRGSMKPMAITQDPSCIVCSPNGALARGESWSLPTRKNGND